MTTYTTTSFQNLHTTRGDEVTHADMLGFLRALTDTLARPLVTISKETLPLWSPATFEGATRRLSGLREVCALVLDYDDGGELDAAHHLWEDYAHVTHTTYSDGATEKLGEPCAERRCCRVILPLARPVTAAEHRRLWRWAEERSRGGGLTVDPATKDPSRAWYVPAHHPDRPAPQQWTSVLDPAGPAPLHPDEVFEGLDVVEGAEQAEARAAEAEAREPLPAPAARAAGNDAPTGPRRGVRTPEGALALALAKAEELPPSVAGEGGDRALYAAACTLRRGYALSEADTLLALRRFNERCTPPWPASRLAHKAKEAGYADHPAWGSALERAPQQPRRERAQQGLSFVALSGAVLMLRPALRFDAFLGAAHEGGRPIDDAYVLKLRHELSARGVETKSAELWEATLHAAGTREHDSLQDMLLALPEYDGVDRLSGAACAYLGVNPEAQPLANTLVARWLVGCVARAMSPGCQADSVLVLQGPQGAGKTTFFRVIAGPGLYLSLDDVGTKDALVNLSGRWIAEIEELDKLAGRRDAATVKAFVSQRHDVFRAPYARTSVSRARRVGFGATTNLKGFLADPTGARRWWPVAVGPVDVPALARDRDQLLAQALRAWRDGAPWHLTREESEALKGAHEEHEQGDEWTAAIGGAIARGEVPDNGRGVTLAEVARCALKLEIGSLRMSEQRDIGTALRRLGYERRAVRGAAGRETRWTKVEVKS